MLDRERKEEIERKLNTAHLKYSNAMAVFKTTPELLNGKTPLDYRLYDEDAQKMTIDVLCVIHEEIDCLRRMFGMLLDILPSAGVGLVSFGSIDYELYRAQAQIDGVRRKLIHQINDTTNNPE